MGYKLRMRPHHRLEPTTLATTNRFSPSEEHNGRMKRKVRKTEVTRFLDAWFRVRQFIQAANFNRFQGAGLSATQFMTLNLLPSGDEGISIGELARRMNLKPATVAKTVDSLETRNLITRLRTASDKRIVFVKSTETGVKLQNAANGLFQAQIEELFRAMLPEERDGLILGLESLTRAAGNDRLIASGELNPGADAAPLAKRSSRRSQPR